jgi:hypothetical protein
MLTLKNAFAASVLLMSFGGIALAESPEPPPRAPSVKSEQQPDRALNNQKKPETEAKPAGSPAEIAAQPAHQPADDANQAGDETSEFATVFNRRFKITDLLLVIFTAGLFVATVFLWLSTRDLVEDAKHNAERQLRAYVFHSEQSTLDVALGKRPRGDILIKNSGLTPATDVLAWAGITVANFPLVEELKRATPEYMKTASRRVVGPGGTFKINPVWEQTLTAQHMQMLENGTAAVFIWGEITYVDIFGRSHKTGINSYFGGDTGLRADGFTTTAIDGNDAY